MMSAIDTALIKAGLTSDHATCLKKTGHLKKLSKKELLITEGSTCNFFGIVITGTLRSFVTNESEEYNTDFYLQEDFVTALTSVLVQKPTSFNIEAVTDSDVFLLSVEQYQQLVSQDPKWALLGKFITETFFIRKCRREISFLKHSAAQRLEMLLMTYPGIEQKVSQYHIASYLGIRPESLSRIKLASATREKG